jgi:hypothetical protein
MEFMAISLGMGVALSIGEAILSSSPRKHIIRVIRVAAGAGLTLATLNFAELVKTAQVVAVASGKKKIMSLTEMALGWLILKFCEYVTIKGYM